MKQIKKLYHFMNAAEGNVKHKFLRSSLWLGIGSILLRSMELVRSVILARLLLPEIFGLMAILQLLRQGIQQFTQMSFGDAIIYRDTKIDESVNTAWILSIIRGLLLFVLLYFLSPFISSFYGEDVLNIGIKVIAIVFIFDGFNNTYMVLYRKNIDFKKIAILNLVTEFLGIVIVITLAYYLRNVWALLFGVLFSSFTKMLLSYRIAEKTPKFQFDKAIAWEMFHYSKYLTGVGILVFLTTRMDDALVGKLLGMKELGFYLNAYFFANLPATHITAILAPLIFPTFAHYSEDQEKMNQLFLRVLKVVSMVTIPAAFGILALSDEIASVLLGEVWAPMAPPLKVLVFFGLFNALAACTGPLFKAIGKPNIIFWIILWKLILILLFIYPLTTNYGILGTAFAVTIPMTLEQFYLWVLVRRSTGIPLKNMLSCLSKPVVISLVMYSLIMLLKTALPLTSIPLFFLYVLFGMLIYAIGVFIFDKDLINEIKSLKDTRKHSTEGKE
jgi:O-antigen/teichoic acid export membrane protein